MFPGHVVVVLLLGEGWVAVGADGEAEVTSTRVCWHGGRLEGTTSSIEAGEVSNKGMAR